MKRPRPKTLSKTAAKAAIPLQRRPPTRTSADPFKRRDPTDTIAAEEQYAHVYGKRVICETDTRGFPTPGNMSPAEIVVDAGDGFVPLWAKDTVLRWRFQEQSLSIFEDPTAAKASLTNLLGESILA